MIRQADTAIRPVPEGQLSDYAIAGQWKTHPELRGKIQARDAELVRFSLRRDSEDTSAYGRVRAFGTGELS